MRRSEQFTNVDTVEIPAEWLDQLEALEPTKPGNPGIIWTPEMDAVLLKYWPVKRQPDVAEILGVCVGVCRNRYRYLTGGRGR